MSETHNTDQKFASLLTPEVTRTLSASSAHYTPIPEIVQSPKSPSEQQGWGGAIAASRDLVKPSSGPLQSHGQKSASETVLGLARQEVGKQEVGNNGGADVERYRSSTPGVPKDAPWCASFVSHLHEKAGVEGIKSAGAVALGHQFGASFTRFNSGKEPKPGDTIVFDHGRGIGHTGIVEGVNTDANGQRVVHTIEGNSHNAVERQSYLMKDLKAGAFGASGFGDLDHYIDRKPELKEQFAARDSSKESVEAQNLPSTHVKQRGERLSRL